MERQQQTDMGTQDHQASVQGGWKVDMRETTRNSKEATRHKIDAQGKGDANARYGKQQLDKKETQGFRWSRTVVIDPIRTNTSTSKVAI
jgi:hypothetical protein